MIQKAEENSPKIIISSYNLLNLDGETFYKTIRAKFPDLPVLFISNTRDEDVISTMMSYPKCDFMLKPVVPEELIARIASCLFMRLSPLKQLLM